MQRFSMVRLVTVGALCLSSQATHAASALDAKGLWLNADKGPVIEFTDCHDTPGTLCATVVWEKDAGATLDTCRLLIARLKKNDDQTWRDGWVHDPRTKRNYKAALRVNIDTLSMRTFIGAEMLGESGEMSSVAVLPAGCKAN
jgi:uncharacterized protein (DUF2147 family)